jgi:hypothetical protein
VNLYDVYATLISINNASGLDSPIVSSAHSEVFGWLMLHSIVTVTSRLPLACG